MACLPVPSCVAVVTNVAVATPLTATSSVLVPSTASPSLMVRVPVGIRFPSLGVTVTENVTFSPKVEGAGLVAVMVVVVATGAATVTVNVRVVVSLPPLAVPPSSATVTVMTAVPDWPATGV